MLRRRRGRAAALPLMLMLPLAAAGLAQDAPDPTGEASSVEDDAKRQPSAPGDAAAAEKSEESAPMDIDTAISGVLTGMMATPRFEEEVVVTDRFQEALDAHLKAAELGCEVARSGPPPSHEELGRYGANPRPPSADLVAPARALARKLSSNEPRFFLYAIRHESTPARVVYVVLDRPVSATMRYSVPETKWELVGEYADRSDAADALAGLERGGDPKARPRQTLWAATGCE